MSTASKPPLPRAEPRSDFRLAGRLVRPALNRVVRAEATLQLEPKIMQVLLALAERPGEVVTRERLFQEVWEGGYVTEDVLTRAVGELRRVFEDDPGKPRVIETIRKTGYRLLAAPEMVAPSCVADAVAPPHPDPLPRAGGDGNPGKAFPWLPISAIVLAVVLIGVVARPWVRSPRAGAPMRIRPLASAPGIERDPALSPDGTRVAFSWNGGSGEAMSIYVQLVDSGAPLRLTAAAAAEDRAPAWSGDGTRVAFTRASGGACRMFVVAALGGAERPLGPCGDSEYRRLAWSPDGKWIALPARDAASALRIELLSPDTLERRPLTRPPAGILGDSSPAFSPDGATVLFTRNLTGGVTDLYRVPAAGGEPVRLTFDDRDTMGSDWSADGKSIVFSSSRAGMYSLWRVEAGGGEPAWIAGGGMKMKHPSTSRSRSRERIAYENWLYQVDLWRVPLAAASAPSAVAPTTDEWSFHPNVSPDGSRVAFVSTRSGEQDVWVTAASGEAGQPARRVTSLTNARVETPRWSPDGSRLVFSARQGGGRSDVWMVDAQGGPPRRLTSGPSDAVAPSWSRDGKSVYYAARPGTDAGGGKGGGGAWQVWRLSLSDGRVAPAAGPGSYAAKESADGRFLYFTRAEERGIWRAPAGNPGAAAERVVDALAPEDWADWESARGGLYYKTMAADHRGSTVAFVAEGAARPVEVAKLPDAGWSGLAVSPDESFLLYSRVGRHACDIRVIDNPQ
jgi:Tol biopolymer transport system component/DNA-binding winged helix-turn-helix (wHTH) protein